MIFFSREGRGLTSTSANHVANMAKEMIRVLETELSSIVLYSTEVGLIGSDKKDTVSRGVDNDTLKGIADKLHSIAKAKSLIAWLREAIKAKERLIKETEDLTLEDFAKEHDIKIPKEPKEGKALTADDYFAEKTLDERNRYYELETLAAVLGKAIHPGGEFADAREDLSRRAFNPHEIKGEGRDTLVYSYVPSVDAELVQKTYFELQNQYREAQARLNELKYECDKAVSDSEVKVRTEYTQAVEKWNGEMTALRARMAEYIRRKTKEYGDMKILIPDSLDPIYRLVSHLGKKDKQD